MHDNSEHEQADGVTVVFPLGVRAGQRIFTPHGEITVGPGRKTVLTAEQHAHLVETHVEGYFDHGDQEPTDAEIYGAQGADRRNRAPRPGTKAYEQWAQDREDENRAITRESTAAHNERTKRRTRETTGRNDEE